MLPDSSYFPLTPSRHSYDAADVAAIRVIAEAERAGAVRAAERLRGAGLACRVISTGSTPTAVHCESFEGITEIRPGNYVFGDVQQAEIGSLRKSDIAVHVLATVIIQNVERGRVIVDAGGMALSKDRGPPGVGFGQVMGLEGVYIGTANQEHGFLAGPNVPVEQLTVGTRVRILPYHACMTSAAFSQYIVVDGAGKATGERWQRFAIGW